MLDYKVLFNYLQLWQSYAILSATTQCAFRTMLDILSIWRWSRLIWHNFIKVAGNWIKICSQAWIETYNRRVKFGIKILNCLGKMSKTSRRDFFDSQCRHNPDCRDCTPVINSPVRQWRDRLHCPYVAAHRTPWYDVSASHVLPSKPNSIWTLPMSGFYLTWP